MLKNRSRRIMVATAVIGLLVFFHWLGILRPLESAIQYVLNPVLGKLYSASTAMRTTYRNQTKKLDLNEVNQELEEEVNKLTINNAELKRVEEENIILREQLRFFKDKELNYVVANVISRGEISDLKTRTETITIDRGSTDGIYEGLPVVSSGGIIVGKIVEAKERIAKACLTNSDKCKLAATVLGSEKTSGITEGELGLTIRMDFIPQASEIKVGDTVVSSGLEETIPRGLVIGRVAEVERESNELWQNATIESLVDPENLIIVSVILP